MTRLACTFALLAVLAVLPGTAFGQQPGSRCADCHFAQTNGPAEDHLFEWDRSEHGRNGIGCDRCHGGNSQLCEPMLAHRGVLNSTNRNSPVNRVNLPETCGGCHTGPATAFQASRHYALLQTGNPRGPTCSTCHEAVAGRLLSAAALEKQCAACHGSDEIAPRAARARDARQMYETLAVVREELKLAHALIRRVEDNQRRADLFDAYEDARAPLTRAISAGHTFVYDDLKQSLRVAQDRIERLMFRVANPAN